MGELRACAGIAFCVLAWSPSGPGVELQIIGPQSRRALAAYALCMPEVTVSIAMVVGCERRVFAARCRGTVERDGRLMRRWQASVLGLSK